MFTFIITFDVFKVHEVCTIGGAQEHSLICPRSYSCENQDLNFAHLSLHLVFFLLYQTSPLKTGDIHIQMTVT